MTCGIYCITNLITGKQYIGQSINIEKRWRSHKSSKDLWLIYKTPYYISHKSKITIWFFMAQITTPQRISHKNQFLLWLKTLTPGF